jgi:hypothetical protein
MAFRDAGMATMAYFYFDFRDAENKNFPTFFPPSSYNSLQGPMPVVTNSPNSILRMIVGYINLAIAQ